MTNENFQEIVLSELRDLKDGQGRVEERLTKVEDGLLHIINTRLDIFTDDFKSIHEILGEHEVSIRTLRRIDFERRKEYYEAMSRENEAKTKRSFPMDE